MDILSLRLRPTCRGRVVDTGMAAGLDRVAGPGWAVKKAGVCDPGCVLQALRYINVDLMSKQELSNTSLNDICLGGGGEA